MSHNKVIAETRNSENKESVIMIKIWTEKKCFIQFDIMVRLVA